jgi:hypothetical protein
MAVRYRKEVLHTMLAATMARAIGGGRSIVVKQVSGNR